MYLFRAIRSETEIIIKTPAIITAFHEIFPPLGPMPVFGNPGIGIKDGVGVGVNVGVSVGIGVGVGVGVGVGEGLTRLVSIEPLVSDAYNGRDTRTSTISNDPINPAIRRNFFMIIKLALLPQSNN